MNGSSQNLPDSWLFRLGGSDASGWLGAFRQDASAAVADLLWSRYYFGPVNVTERGQLLAGWLETLGDDEGFAEELDARLAEWVDTNWGKFDQPGVMLASAWICLASVVEFSARLNPSGRLVNAAEALRARFPERNRFLGSFSTAPAADPLGHYLAAIAEFQGDDRSLAAFWHRLCDLPDGVPFYHARYALLGLRRLKATDPWENGSLRAEVVLGLMRLATAFDRLVRERGLAENTAKTTFRRVAAQLAAAYPDSPGWSKHGLAVVLHLQARPQRWVLDAIRPLATAARQEHALANRPHTRPRRSIEPNRQWPDMRAKALDHLHSGRLDRLPEIEQLLDEQRHYAEATGDTYFVVRSLCNFASRILRLQPHIARRWAEEARGWEPQNSFTWTTIKDVLLKQQDVDLALRLSWVAWKRFPENVVVRNGLAEVLKAAMRLPEAQEVYRQTIERFPENVFAHAGLAEVLKVAGRFPEAEEVYRQTIERFPADVVARTGLAELLKAAGRYPEAEEAYRQTIERFPSDVVARNGLADTLRRAQRWSDAETAYRAAIAAGYVDCYTYVGLAYLLLRRGEAGRAEAFSLVDQALRRDRRNSHALALKKRLEPAKGADVAAIADEWDEVADTLRSPQDTRETYEEVEVESPTTPDIDTEQTPVHGGAMPTLPEQWPSSPVIHAHQVVRRAPPEESLEVMALVTEASFYRAWAARSASDIASQHRQKASTLLARAEALSPHDAQLVAERVALERSQAGSETTAGRLVTELGKHPASAPLLVLKARLDREIARHEQRRLSDEALQRLLHAPQRLRDLDSALLPAFHLEKGLAALALLDGAVRIEKAADAFSSFRRIVSRRASEERTDREASHDARAKNVPRFHEWLESTTSNRLFRDFAEPDAVQASEVLALEQSLAENPFLFEEVEDVIVDRFAFAGA